MLEMTRKDVPGRESCMLTGQLCITPGQYFQTIWADMASQVPSASLSSKWSLMKPSSLPTADFLFNNLLSNSPRVHVEGCGVPEAG